MTEDTKTKTKSSNTTRIAFAVATQPRDVQQKLIVATDAIEELGGMVLGVTSYVALGLKHVVCFTFEIPKNKTDKLAPLYHDLLEK